MVWKFSDLSQSLRLKLMAFPAVVLAAALLIGVSEFAYRQADASMTTLVSYGKARLELLHILRRISDAESGKRGYLLVGGEAYLTPYKAAAEDARHSLAELERLYRETGDSLAEQQRQRVMALVNAKIEEMESVLALDDAGRRDAALDMVRSGRGRQLMDDLRVAVDAAVAHQNEQIARGLARVFDSLSFSRYGVIAMTVLSLGLLALFMRQGRLLQRHREEQQAALRAERDRLEQEVGLRTADLTELARHLQSAREDERARLARELHDELGALLTSAKLDVARLKPSIRQALPDLEPRLSHLTDALNSGIALKRRIIEDLHPSTLGSLGLTAALDILCREFAERSNLEMDLAIERVPRDAERDLTIYRVVQEALTNIAKYAKAHRVVVRLGVEGDESVLRIEDDGVGFDPGRRTLSSHGLRGMQFRVEAVRGRFEVRSAPGGGTRLSARLPLPTASSPRPTAG